MRVPRISDLPRLEPRQIAVLVAVVAVGAVVVVAAAAGLDRSTRQVDLAETDQRVLIDQLEDLRARAQATDVENKRLQADRERFRSQILTSIEQLRAAGEIPIIVAPDAIQPGPVATTVPPETSSAPPVFVPVPVPQETPPTIMVPAPPPSTSPPATQPPDTAPPPPEPPPPTTEPPPPSETTGAP